MRRSLRGLLVFLSFATPAWLNLQNSPIVVHPPVGKFGMFAEVVEGKCRYASIDPKDPYSRSPEAVAHLTTFVRAHLDRDDRTLIGWVLSALAAFIVGDLMFFRRNTRRKLVRSDRPSRNAEYLFYLFLDPKDCDALVGDLDERYKLIFEKFGKGKADFWYWSQAIRSTGPIVWAWFKKLVMKPVLWLSSSLIAHGLLKDGLLLEFAKNVLAELVKRVRG